MMYKFNKNPSSQALLYLIVVSVSTNFITAFAPGTIKYKYNHGLTAAIRSSFLVPTSFGGRNSHFYSSESDAVEGEAEQVEAELTDESPTLDEGGEDVEDPVEEIDPEIKALKDEIEVLESNLKNKNRDLNRLENLCEDYSQAGYARKVAQMEGYRKNRQSAFSENKFTARASVVKNFLPILDNLQSLDVEYEGDEFAKKYSALGWDFKNALKDLEMTEFSVQIGDAVDGRVSVVDEIYSEEISKGCVVEVLRDGYELHGNVMRTAEVIASMGSEAEAKAEAEAEAEDMSGEEGAPGTEEAPEEE
mmetsp:Transcript_21624/g.30300  ORF Transcript_21624/g.30300 Transcript_21624/m.30300 type:complete len:305 (+) Transcript_21624:72-986(+)|eukprot:CAMPEP_0184867110 /NCGR_PEP_ID=MMETSP0580-20130426/25050_1 /TAXON_ID=1118495 /ORGANISM="Dactyliosolen fragilissimus" /LENGTH=304 /DNA_ID=CAMNT_0027367159 /DNA_START=51 /DNA_END=965 /DNA_ORIENTATION=+